MSTTRPKGEPMSRSTEKLALEARALADRTTAESGRVLADLANVVDQNQETFDRILRRLDSLELALSRKADSVWRADQRAEALYLQALARRAGLADSDVNEILTATRERAHEIFSQALADCHPGTCVLSDPRAAADGAALTAP